MTTEALPTGPDPEAITRTISDVYPEAYMITIDGASFFSLDEKHFPNFATIVWKDDFDDGTPSELSRPGVFRLNVGVSRETYDRLVGAVEQPDYASFDRVVPHPVYARQHWVSILNPSDETFRDIALPLIAEAHDRLAAARARHRVPQDSA